MTKVDNDIFHEWKEKRFVIAPQELIDDGVNLIILSDYRYWAEHMDALTAWCNHRDADIQGMTVAMKGNATLTEFLLRWS